MNRFQELNKQLLEKVKDTEQNMMEREYANSNVNEDLLKTKKEN
jgi:molybdopterin converting factor small subunit